tara:strand:- start:60 stop:263 length:204 start_codon:yes stop_codon:yes gene_type:complete
MNEELLLAMGRLEGKVDSLITRQAIHDEELKRMETRLRKLENSRSWLMGASAAVGASVSFLLQWLKH